MRKITAAQTPPNNFWQAVTPSVELKTWMNFSTKHQNGAEFGEINLQNNLQIF